MPVDLQDNLKAPLKAWVRALERTAPILANPSATLPALIDDLADAFETAVAFLADGENLSYRALAQRCNRYARWALGQGLAAGDVVCLLMLNCPDYMAIWLGVTRIGATVSLINTNLVGSQLAHSINIVAPKHIIVGGELVDAVTDVLTQLSPGIQYWAHGQGNQGFPRVDHEIRCLEGDKLCRSEYQPPSIMDRALIYIRPAQRAYPKP